MTTTKYRKKPQVEQALGMTFDKYVRTVANPQGLTQGQMAKQCKVQQLTIARWLEDDNFKRLHRAFYVQVDEAAA